MEQTIHTVELLLDFLVFYVFKVEILKILANQFINFDQFLKKIKLDMYTFNTSRDSRVS